MALVSTQMSLERLLNAMDTLRPLLSAKLDAVFQFAPTVTKYIVFLLFMVNIRSWPLHSLVRLRNVFKSKIAKIRAEDKWLDSISSIGNDPLNYLVRYNTWASIDDSDFNGHLSNSSYAKTLDSARFKAALAMFPRFFAAGGWMALAGTHYNFIREIPMLSSYEVRLSVGSWDQKWIYVVAKFVTKPSKKGKKTPKAVEQPMSSSNIDTNGTLFNASLRTDNQVSTTPTPADITDPSLRTSDALKAVAASLSSQPEPDGAILNTISVSQCCFKIGRITVPPAVVLAVNGFSVPASPHADGSPAVPYSRSNPPPHWAQAKAVMSRSAGGSKRKLQELFKGGWRDVPEAERWWDAAMGGAVEEKRRKGLEVLQSLGLGIAGARNL
ncbi:hypothetical protein C0995_015618 [Termitomyces sp. Mi166|nr:hypothetical protein C0995_013994 [Termitomyces sp. Mi166\